MPRHKVNNQLTLIELVAQIIGNGFKIFGAFQQLVGTVHDALRVGHEGVDVHHRAVEFFKLLHRLLQLLQNREVVLRHFRYLHFVDGFQQIALRQNSFGIGGKNTRQVFQVGGKLAVEFHQIALQRFQRCRQSLINNRQQFHLHESVKLVLPRLHQRPRPFERAARVDNGKC